MIKKIRYPVTRPAEEVIFTEYLNVNLNTSERQFTLTMDSLFAQDLPSYGQYSVPCIFFEKNCVMLLGSLLISAPARKITYYPLSLTEVSIESE